VINMADVFHPQSVQHPESDSDHWLAVRNATWFQVSQSIELGVSWCPDTPIFDHGVSS